MCFTCISDKSFTHLLRCISVFDASLELLFFIFQHCYPIVFSQTNFIQSRDIWEFKYEGNKPLDDGLRPKNTSLEGETDLTEFLVAVSPNPKHVHMYQG